MTLTGFLLAASTGVVLAPLSQTPGGGWHHDMPWMGWGGWWMGPVMSLIFLVLAVLAIIALWRFIRGGAGRAGYGGPDRSLEILRERFARGEIDEEEYEARKKALGR